LISRGELILLFGDRIRQLRESTGMTQVQLGKLIGISDRVLGYYEANDRLPRKQELIAKFAEVFRVSVGYLFGVEDTIIHDNSEEYSHIKHRQAQHLIKDAKVLLYGRELTEDDKDEFFRILFELYFTCKKKNKEKI
jgi:transcriptional regulator with XRE-family HTH domain